MPLQFERAASLFSSVGGVRPFRYYRRFFFPPEITMVRETLQFTNLYNGLTQDTCELRDDETVVITNYTAVRIIDSWNHGFAGLGLGYVEQGAASGSTPTDPVILAHNAWDFSTPNIQTPVMVSIPKPVILSYALERNFWGSPLTQSDFKLVAIGDRIPAMGAQAGVDVTASGFIIKTGSLAHTIISVPV